MSIFLALLLWVAAHLFHVDVDVSEPVPPVAAFRSPAPVPPPPVVAPSDRPTTPHPAPPAAPPECQPGEEFQGEFGCVAVQLPEESAGRAYG